MSKPDDDMVTALEKRLAPILVKADITLKDAIKKAQANSKLLRDCDRPHSFVPEDSDSIVSDYRCTKCGGVVNKIHALWYDRGLEDGRRIT